MAVRACDRYSDFEAQCLQMAPANHVQYGGMRERERRAETSEGMPCLCKPLV